MLHLKKLSHAGITHVHLLPTYHFAGVDDDKRKWQTVGTNLLIMLLLVHLDSFSLDSIEVIISSIICYCTCWHQLKDNKIGTQKS